MKKRTPSTIEGSPTKLQGRYQIKGIIGRGGMGVVYRAYDLGVKREVAVKTLRDAPGRTALEMFQRECEVLASLSHPNIVEIFDVGETEENGERKPFFVMPLLPGTPLDKLIYSPGAKISVERAIEIILQACRGLQAAHERGLVHRDLKPSNIFVMKDDSVKIIDFGVAHMVDSRITRGQKGTLMYMAPEQIEMKPLTAQCDLFSLGVLTYETVTQHHPFARAGEAEIVKAILEEVPPPASEYNSAVRQNLSQVIQKSMAKLSRHRYSSAREFAETLRKAIHNEPIEFFDPANVQPRIQRAEKAFEQGDFQFASEILHELRAEGCLTPEIDLLRGQIDRASRQKRIRELLDSARSRIDQQEYPLAMQRVQEALQLDPENAMALGLKNTIDARRVEREVDSLLRTAQQYVDTQALVDARRLLENALRLKSKETRASDLLAEIDRREQEYAKLREEKEHLYRAALETWQRGSLNSALMKMEAIRQLNARTPDPTSPERNSVYEKFYNQIHAEQEAVDRAYATAQKEIEDRDFDSALAACAECLAKYPDDARFQALKFQAEERRSQELAAFIVELDRQLDAEPDLEARVNLLQSALNKYPKELHFERALRVVLERQELVNSIVAKARFYQDRGLWSEALEQWETLQNVHPAYPGLDSELNQVKTKQEEQARFELRDRLIQELRQGLLSSDLPRTLQLAAEALVEFPNDAEIKDFERRAHKGMERDAEVQTLLDGANDLTGEEQIEQKLGFLRRAFELKPEDSTIRALLSDTLVERGHCLLATDWRKAEVPIEEALEIDPEHALAKSLRGLLVDRKKQELVDQCLSRSLQLEVDNNLEGAIEEVKTALRSFPHEEPLTQLYSTLKTTLLETQRQTMRVSDIEELKKLTLRSESVTDPTEIHGISELAQKIAQEYIGDPEIELLATSIGLRLQTLTPPTETEPARLLGEIELSSSGQESPIPTDKELGSWPAGREATILQRARMTVTTLIQGRGYGGGKKGRWQGRAGQLLVWMSTIVMTILLVATHFHRLRPSKPVPTSLPTALAQQNPSPLVPASPQTASQSQSSSPSNASGNMPGSAPSTATAALSKRRPMKNSRSLSATNTRTRERSSKSTNEKGEKSAAENTRPTPISSSAPALSPVNRPQQEPKHGEVDFQIMPPGTEIFEGGRLLGRSPFQVTLPVGGHTLKLIPPAGWVPLEENYVVKPGVYGFSQTMVRLRTGGVNTQTESRRPATSTVVTTSNRLVDGGAVTLITDPAGASVLVDGTFYGRTPTSFLVPMGKHRLTISLAGFQSTEQAIFVPRHGHVPISIALRRK